MFEILRTVPDGVAVKAVYRASLELYRRARIGNWREDADIDAPVRLPRPLHAATATEAQVIGNLLAEIEEMEGKPLRALSQRVAAKYIIQLSEIQSEKTRSRPDYDPDLGQTLLEELRRDYGPGYRHNAAA
ncbi:MAG TPA: hypothetical protein VFR81_00895 [Longimicrobium sp.]|nr:hypothetical protein [Longimicrobium sp.]